QCRSCNVVYVNSPAREVRDYFHLASAEERPTVEDQAHLRKEVEDVLGYAADVGRTRRGSAPQRVLLVGRVPEDVASLQFPGRVDAVRLTREETARLVHEADVAPILAAIDDGVDLIVLNQVLEACPR